MRHQRIEIARLSIIRSHLTSAQLVHTRTRSFFTSRSHTMAVAAASATMELAQTGKRDQLRELEKKYQAQWADEHIFEVDAPSRAGTQTAEQVRDDGNPKWTGNTPYAYMNGSLHVGHSFTVSKVEFAAGFQRMLGKRALFPVGYHCTGLPIKASADKLVREMAMFGDNFERHSQDAAEEPAPAPAATTTATSDNIAAKSTGLKYQFEIMETMGIPRSDIKKFADPYYWTDYYPRITRADLTLFGARVDWRRQFITTDRNPYYDSFVRWQMNKLRSLERVRFGERYTIYSPKDGQPCMDHDRSEGEGVGPQEYTALKLEVVEWSGPAAAVVKEAIGSSKAYLVAATLRPETMYGQTNCFVGTKITYGVFTANDKEVYICTYRAARNMAFQKDIFSVPGEVRQIAEISGELIVGTKVKGPFSIIPEVYVLPMDNVLPDKGTGVVTSVPSDSPDDYATLMDVRKKPDTPAYGEMTAPALCAQMKIQSQKDKVQLAEAKAVAYKEGFYSGTMLIGDFKGESVQDAKPKVRAQMIEQGLAFAYAEPDGFVQSRSGDECIVALMDQWYMDYGEESWKKDAVALVKQMEMYSLETRHAFEKVLDWLNKWACARTYGLGSKVPWDPTFLVESLSDSTIYMAYYTVAYLLQGGEFDGSKTGPLGVTPDQMTDEVWDYIFRDEAWPTSAPLPKEKADALKWEFEYWYPMDIRSSGKDLIPNHLTFCVYVHAALFAPKYWPRSMRANGHLVINGQKMSKSKGNFLTLRETVEKFGADPTRICLADAGDGIEDANFDEKNANAMILRVHTLIEWCKDVVTNAANMRDGEKNFHDRVFEEEMNDLINSTKEHYEKTNYKDALKSGFFEMQMSRDWYREIMLDYGGMHRELALAWIRNQALLVLPVAPHYAEHIWSTILGEPKSVQHALWPASRVADPSVLETGQYLRATVSKLREAEGAAIKALQKQKSGKNIAVRFDPAKKKAIRMYVASAFPEWQDASVQLVQDHYDAATGAVDDGKIREGLAKAGLMKDKRVMPFVQAFKKRITQIGAKAAFQRKLAFSEVEALSELVPYAKRNMNLEQARNRTQEPGWNANIIDSAEPGSPSYEFRNVD
ncbi:leucyl-tRNA synthetase [Auriculariales sp. MPI-PUGE-AT-0066]|nr:leucyl-tRNA synthetase [Auriculariales sp. MPI-PUGE-AT-0066]